MPQDKLAPTGAVRAGEFAALVPAYLESRDIAELAFLLASDEACYLKDAIIPADAGWKAL